MGLVVQHVFSNRRINSRCVRVGFMQHLSEIDLAGRRNWVFCCRPIGRALHVERQLICAAAGASRTTSKRCCASPPNHGLQRPGHAADLTPLVDQPGRDVSKGWSTLRLRSSKVSPRPPPLQQALGFRPDLSISGQNPRSVPVLRVAPAASPEDDAADRVHDGDL